MVFIILFMCCCLVMVSIIATIAFYLVGEDTSCSGDDKNAEFEYDGEGECVFTGCKPGYTLNGDDICALGDEDEFEDEDEDEVEDEDEYEDDFTPVPQNCEATPNSWGTCTALCGGGTQTRGWTITADETGGGTCPERGQTETQTCNADACYETFDRNTDIEYLSSGKSTEVLENLGWVDCDYNSSKRGGLKRFQLDRTSGLADRVEYEYTCLDEKTNPSLIALTFTGNVSPEAANAGNAYDLDYFPVDCGDYPISAFHFEHEGRYKFRCITNTPHTGQCRDLTTQWDDRSSEIVYLDRHNVNCDGDNEVITKFVLENNDSKDKIRYKYRCCTMPTPK